MEKLIALFKEENFDEIEKLIEGHQDYVSSAITKLEQVKWIYRRNTGTLRKVALIKAPFLIKVFDDCKWLYGIALAGSKVIILNRAEALSTTIPELLWVYERSNLAERDSLLSKIESKMTSFRLCSDAFARSGDDTVKNAAIKIAIDLAETPINIIWIRKNSPGKINPKLLQKASKTLKNFKDCKSLWDNSDDIILKNLAVTTAKKMIFRFSHCKWIYKKLESTEKFSFLHGVATDYDMEFYDFVWIYKKARNHQDPILMERMIEKIKLLTIPFAYAKWLYENTEGPLHDYGFSRAKDVTANFESLLKSYVSGENEFGKLYKTKLQESFTTYEEYETMLVLCDGLVGKVAKEKINRILWD